jgi:hypothetical protein
MYRMVHEYKAYRLIPLMAPFFNGWTIPLTIGKMANTVIARQMTIIKVKITTEVPKKI